MVVTRQNHSLEKTLQMLAEEKVNVKPMATHRFDFTDTKAAFNIYFSLY